MWKNNIVANTVESPDQLLAHYANPRTHDGKQRDTMRASLDELGIIAPCTVNDRTGNMIDGHMRTEEYLTAGVKEVPVIHLDLSEEDELKAIAYFDAVGTLAGYNADKLEDLLEQIDFVSEPLENMLTDLLDKKIKPLPEDIDDVPEVETPISKLGDLWLLDGHRVLCGDSTDQATVEQLMGGKKADIVFTDPPYNVDYEGKTKEKLKIDNDTWDNPDLFYQFLWKAFQQMFLNMKPGASFYICHSDSEGLAFRRAVNEVGFYLKQCIIWNKNSMVMGRQDYQWKHEPILYGWKPGAAHYFIDDRKQTTVWDIDRPSRSAEHPTMKPIELCALGISNSSRPKSILLDLFLGSGSTLIACEQTDRTCYGLELDPHYVDVICKRWQLLTGQLPVLESSGEAHDFTK